MPETDSERPMSKIEEAPQRDDVLKNVACQESGLIPSVPTPGGNLPAETSDATTTGENVDVVKQGKTSPLDSCYSGTSGKSLVTSGNDEGAGAMEVERTVSRDKDRIVAEEPPSSNVLPTVGPCTGIKVNTEGASIVSLPFEIRLPNYTMGKSPSFVVWPSDRSIPEEIQFNTRQFKCDNVDVEVADGKLKFYPSMPGEAKIPFTYNNDKTVIFRLTINPDPWSLWPDPPPQVSQDKVVFDSDHDRLKDNHKSTVYESHRSLRIFGASRRGRSHERAGTFRDDDLGVWSDEKNGNYVFLVSDGAGSCKYSREGAFQAICCIKEKLENNKDKLESAWKASQNNLKPDCNVGMLLAQLALKAKEELLALAARTNEAGKECRVKDFSCTLLMAALKLDVGGGAQLVTFSIGDGAIAWRSGDDKFGLMCRPDSGEFGGGTRFLASPEVWKSIFYPQKDIPWTWNSFCESRVLCKNFTPDETRGLQIFLMTDGVSDPWFESDAKLEDATRWHGFVNEVLTQKGDNKANLDLNDPPDANAEKLWEWLYFKIVGNHDDRTLIMAYTTEGMKEVVNG